jgi:hypothetical protein
MCFASAQPNRARSLCTVSVWDGCGGSLQYLLPSPLHIAMPLQRILKHIGHGQAPFRGRVKRVPRTSGAGLMRVQQTNPTRSPRRRDRAARAAIQAQASWRRDASFRPARPETDSVAGVRGLELGNGARNHRIATGCGSCQSCRYDASFSKLFDARAISRRYLDVGCSRVGGCRHVR